MNTLTQNAENIIFDTPQFTQKAVSVAMDKIAATCADYADIYVQSGFYEQWHLEESIVKSGSFSARRGFGVRAVTGSQTAFAYADNPEDRALENATAAVVSVTHGQSQRTQGKVSGSLNGSIYTADNPVTAMNAADKVALLQKIDTLTRAMDNRVKEVNASIVSAMEYVWLKRLDGRTHGDIRPMLRLSLSVIVEENGRREHGAAGGGGRVNVDYFSDDVINQYIKTAVNQAIINLSARPAPAGDMPVVLGSGWPGVLLHEAVGHGLEGDFNRKGTSVFTGKIGQQVAAKGVTVIDQGNLPQRRGSLNIDDEGNATQKTVLIEDGVLQAYMQDEMNARLMNMPLTGNGRRESYAAPPMPRMTNTFMANGEYSPDEIIASVKYGIYAENFGGGQVDITNGQFVFGTSSAWLIENGKLSYPVKGAMLTGNGAETLKHISMIGNNSELDTGIGVCGKDGQSVPVGVGMPTVRIDGGLTVGGVL